jgi:phosphopantetheinyl transferase (holo-ACP synthase)
VISAGNDIVALKAVDQQRTLLPAFYSKFITTAELTLHEHPALPFSTFVWLVWSVKESAYKYLKRGDAGLLFSPSKIIVEQLTAADDIAGDKLQNETPVDFCYIGVVSYGEATLYFKTIINNDFLATVITVGNVYWGVQRIGGTGYESQSAAVRGFILDKLSSLLPSSQLRIEKHAVGYPVIYDGSRQLDIPLSFAHHGSFVSYSFQIPK